MAGLRFVTQPHICFVGAACRLAAVQEFARGTKQPIKNAAMMSVCRGEADSARGHL